MCIDFWATHKALTYLKLWVYLSNLSSTFPRSLFLFPSAFCSSNPNACDGTCKLGSSLVSVISRGSGGSQWSLSLATILGHSTQPLWLLPVMFLSMCAGTHTKNCQLQKDFFKHHIISNNQWSIIFFIPTLSTSLNCHKATLAVASKYMGN